MKIKLILIFVLSHNLLNSLSLSNWKYKISQEVGYNFHNLIDKKLQKIKKDIVKTKISPFYKNRNKNFKSGFKVNNYKVLTQRRFLKTKFKNHSWTWWWQNNKSIFIVLFPLYFQNKYGYYPPIYYDFYAEFGYYPDNQYFDICLDKYMISYKKNIKPTQYKSKYKSEYQYLETCLDFCVNEFYRNLLN